MVYLFVFSYFLILLIIGFYSNKQIKTNDDFFLGGRNSKSLIITGSLLATILGSSAVLGTANMAHDMGFSAMWWLLCAFIGLIILLPFSKLIRRYGNYSFPELIEFLYGKETFYLSSIIIPIAWIGIISAQIIGSAKILNSFLGIEYFYGALLSGIIFIIYTFSGGQMAILKTDIIQVFFIIIGILYLFIHLLFFAEGNVFGKFSLTFPFSPDFRWFDLIVLFLTLSTTYFVGPDIYSRLFCAKDEKTAIRSVFYTSIIVLIFSFIITYIGVYGSHFSDIDTGNQSVIIELSLQMLPQWAIGLIIAGLLSAIMSSADVTILTASTIISEIFCKNTRDNFIFLTRIFIIIIGILSIILSLYIQNIIASMLIALTIFSGGFVIPTIVGILGYRPCRRKVNIAIISGGLIAFGGKLIQMRIDSFWGNLIIISGFLINAIILFIPLKTINNYKKDIIN